MEHIIFDIESVICGFPLLVVLMSTHVFFTFKLKFPQKNILKVIYYMLKSNKANDKDGISLYKSLMSVLASTLGTGNIIGIATAITIGGIGSIFWIFISGIFAIATKYAETYIVLKYRKKDKFGKYYGGAMYVLKDRLDLKIISKLFCIFLIFTTFGMGAMIQSNAVSLCLVQSFNLNKHIVGIIIVLLCAYTLLGNERRISNISSVFIPIATVIYIISCCILMYIYRENLSCSIMYIIKEAFDFKSLTGGIFGSVGIIAMNTGISKGLFTNEAGMGTSPIFDVSLKEKDIKKQSIISETSVFLDTVLLCTLTGIVFVTTGMYNISTNSRVIAQETFSVLPLGKYIYIFMITVFAISTIPCSGFYGTKAVNFLFLNKKFYIVIYRLIFLICVFVGTITKIELVWSISAISNALMIIPNVIMIYKLKEEIK